MWEVRCPYCGVTTQGRCATTAAGRAVTECCSCGRVVEERQAQTHPLFLLRAVDTPLSLVTPDLRMPPAPALPELGDDDPFHPTGFVTAFSAWSLERAPLFARSASSFSGHLAELERALDCPSSSDPSGPLVSVDSLRAYLQILEVASILRLDRDIADHAFELFKDCSSATCLRNRSVEALATAALVQAIREAQEPRTLQEISTASSLPQKEIGKYIKILGEALKLSQPLNSNSISVHMPRFCSLLQLNKSAQELAAHIGEVVVNKCFCTRRNPISISAAAIYLACQLEDNRKTQAEICKVTGLTEVTLRKVYKELLENWDDLLPPNYTPAMPPEKAFPLTAICSGRSSTIKVDTVEIPKQNKVSEDLEADRMVIVKEEEEKQVRSHGHSPGKFEARDTNQVAFWLSGGSPYTMPSSKADRPKTDTSETRFGSSESSKKIDRVSKIGGAERWMGHMNLLSSSAKKYPNPWQTAAPHSVAGSSHGRFAGEQLGLEFASALKGLGKQSGADEANGHGKKDEQKKN